jgi:hypothetical protein
MQLLKENIRKNGYDYRLLERGERSFIYEQWDDEDNFIVAYEVFRLKISKAKEVFGDIMPEREVFPGNEDFGVWAWSYRNLEKAYEKYTRLESGEEDLGDTLSQELEGISEEDDEEEEGDPLG